MLPLWLPVPPRRWPGRARLLTGGCATLLVAAGLALLPYPDAAQGAAAAAAPCAAVADQQVRPAEVVLGGTVAVTLELQLTCDAAPAPVDVILVVDRSASMAGPSLADAVAAVDAFVAAVDFSRSRVALVSFAADATRDARLSTDPELVRSAARRLVADGNTFIAGGLREAGRTLETAPMVSGALPVIVLLTDGHDSLGAGAVRSQAALQRASGHYLVTIALGLRADRALLSEIASSPADAWFAPRSGDLARIYARISSRLMAVTAAQLSLLNQLPPNMLVEVASLRPAARLRPGDLLWQVPGVPDGVFRATYRLRPSELGWHPVSLGATARFTDTRGRVGAAVFPVPGVLVLAELPTPGADETPVRPTATPSAVARASVTPTASPVLATPVRPDATGTRRPGPGGPGWHPLYLPLAVNRWCVTAGPDDGAESCR